MIMLLRVRRQQWRKDVDRELSVDMTQGRVQQLRWRRDDAVSEERQSCNVTSLGLMSRSKSFELTLRARSRHRDRDRRPGRNMKNSSVDVGVSQDADADQNLVQSRPIHSWWMTSPSTSYRNTDVSARLPIDATQQRLERWQMTQRRQRCRQCNFDINEFVDDASGATTSKSYISRISWCEAAQHGTDLSG
jgi:hypothetical protein